MVDGQVRLQAIPPKRRIDQIVEQIERLILAQELQIGDALPSLNELAAQLQVSRNILREAIGMLAQKGLLEVRHGSGTFVARPTTDFVRDSLTTFFRFNRDYLFDLIEVRFSLEVQTSSLAASRASDDDLALIAARLAEMEAALDDVATFVDADVSFHAAIARASKNRILEKLLESIRGALREEIELLVTYQVPARGESMAYHRQIVAAIQRRAPDQAREAMQSHLESVQRGLLHLREAQVEREAARDV